MTCISWGLCHELDFQSVCGGSGRAGTLTTVFMLYTQIGFDIDLRAGDRVRVGGALVLDVDGTPMKWPDPFTGRVHHVEARLKVIHG